MWVQENQNIPVRIIAINNITVILACFKLLYFGKLFQGYFKLIVLLQETLSKLLEFAFFFFSLVVIVTTLFRLSGAQLHDSKDIDDVPFFFQEIIQGFRNSIGDIEVPSYDWYSSHPNSTNMNNPTLDLQHDKHSQFLIYWIWTLFVMSEFLMVIVLLNFIISSIGQGYEEVMGNIGEFILRS